MRYSDFISELQRRVAEAEQIRNSGVTHEDPHFRTWRHATESLVEGVEEQGYRLPGNVSSVHRAYRAFYAGASKEADAAALAKDVRDTEIQLNFLIEHYERYGEPDPIVHEPAVSAELLSVPERVTLAWLFKNVPVRLWVSAFVALVAIFLAGAKVGHMEAYKVFEASIRSIFSEENTATLNSPVDGNGI